MNKEKPLCECEKYKCTEFGKDNMKTVEKETGRIAQIVKAVIANCIQFFNPKKND